MNCYEEQMRRFGAANRGDEVTYCQPGAGIDAGIYDGKLMVSVDCYTLLDERGGKDFDVDAWEAQTIWLEPGAHLSARDAWYEAFRVARGLVRGKEVVFADGRALSMRSHVAAVSNSTEMRP